METEIINTLKSHDYLPAVMGGILVSLSTTVNLYGKGRSTNIPNMLYDLVRLRNFYSKLVFFLGIIWVATFLKVFYASKLDLFEKPAVNTENLTIIGYIISGFLLGLGTRLANGDSSEHVYCGIPCLSKRSITYLLFSSVASVGTATFNSYFGFTHKLNMGRGETSFFQMLKNKLNPQRLNPMKTDIDHTLFSNTIQTPLLYATTALVILLFLHDTYFKLKTYNFEVSFISGILFGAGIILAGLTNREKVLQGLSFNMTYDSTLMIFTVTVIISNLILWNLTSNVTRKPIFDESYDLITDNRVDLRLIIGSILAGIALGISGFFAGSSIVSFTVYFPRIAIYLISLLVGQFTTDMLFNDSLRADIKQQIEKKIE